MTSEGIPKEVVKKWYEKLQAIHMLQHWPPKVEVELHELLKEMASYLEKE